MFSKLYLLRAMARQRMLLSKHLREITKLEKEVYRLRMVEAENFLTSTSNRELEAQNREFSCRWIKCRDELKKLKELHNTNEI